MRRITHRCWKAVALTALTLAFLPSAAPADQPGKSPVKVFVMAGQSNMEGQGLVEFSDLRTEDYRRRGLSEEAIAEKHKGVLDYVVRSAAETERFRHVVDQDDRWVVRDDVWVYYLRGRGELKKGKLSVGFGANDERIGPEFQFGHAIGDALDNQVLLIKTAWGGKSLAVDFRPPSAGQPDFAMPTRPDRPAPEIGKYYRDMIAEVRGVLKDLKTHFPEYDGQGYEIAGFVWFQGWNDGCNQDFSEEYEKNMPLLIRDVRRDLGVEDLPFVIANSGFGGRQPQGGVVGRLQQLVQPAQAAAAKTVEGVICIDTRDFYRPEAVSPGRGDIEHWYCNAETYFLIGDALGQAMKRLCAE